MVIDGCPWISMDIMDSNGYPWISRSVSQSPSCTKTSHGKNDVSRKRAAASMVEFINMDSNIVLPDLVRYVYYRPWWGGVVAPSSRSSQLSGGSKTIGSHCL